MDDYYRGMTQRTGLVVGAEGLDRLSGARVIVFGLGGVGSWCAEALVRSGIRRLCLVDCDAVCASNVNRQVQATSRAIGCPKASELRLRLLDIDPEAEIVARDEAFTAETKGDFGIETYDYVVDAIDCLTDKALLIETCLRLGKKLVSSMGAGARSDPSLVRIGKLSNTRNCGLARALRKRLRKEKFRTDFLCAYSEELPVEPASGIPPEAARKDPATGVDRSTGKKRVNGALVHVTGVFGFTIAGTIIRDIVGIKAIPVRIQAS